MKDIWVITVQSDLEVVGFNSENADFDRPRGEIIGTVYFLQAENERGDRRTFGLSWSSPDVAEAAIPDAPPVFLWYRDRPCYGSEAWQRYGEREQMAAERRLNEAEGWGIDTRYMVA